MKKLGYLLLAIGLCLGAAAQAESANPFVGTWYFVSGEYTSAGGSITQVDNSSFKALRTMNSDSFAVINMGMGEFKGWLQGDYSLADGVMTELPKKGSGGDLIGKTLHFKYTLEGDTWTAEGQEAGTHIKEVWRKLD